MHPGEKCCQVLSVGRRGTGWQNLSYKHASSPSQSRRSTETSRKICLASMSGRGLAEPSQEGSNALLNQRAYPGCNKCPTPGGLGQVQG